MDDIIEEYGIKKPLYVYKLIENFDELLLVNIAFIQGKVKQSPNYYGYINSKSIYSAKLININKFGFLTLDGQKSKCEYEIQMDNIFCSYEKKSYITGFMNKKYVSKLIKYMNNNTNKSYIS